MSDHLVLCADRLITSASIGPMQSPHLAGLIGPSREINYFYRAANGGWEAQEFRVSEEREADGERIECRICHEEDFTKKMEAPCACNGSLKFAHRKCIQHWCNEKKNTICEICHQPYQAGYTAPYVPRAEDTALDIRDLEFYCREGINIPSNPREVHFQRVVAATAEEEYLLEPEYDECAAASGTRTRIIRSCFLILLAVLMMRHAFSLVDEDDNDLYNLLSVFLLRILAFLMPVYIMAWIAAVLLHRSQRHGSGFIGIA
ncbi:uncharacterized protein LOC130772953 isoform X2 [Actinidia eriantha]|nr:uncharacterized protein LOC130772953 isoform X2 [Actinidia eriantha]XP_057486846.1 uncharacterized protein LOC130772953 isoform X2 [Actinidia eriantha]